MSTAFTIRVPDEFLADVKDAAEAAGESLTTYVKVALEMRMDPPVIGSVPRETVAQTMLAVGEWVNENIEAPSDDNRALHAPPPKNPVSPPTREYLEAKAEARRLAELNCVHKYRTQAGVCVACGNQR